MKPRSAGPARRRSKPDSPPPRRGRKRRRLVFLLLGAILLLTLLMLARSPAVERSSAPDAAQIQRARDVYERVRFAQVAPGRQRITVSWQELRDVAALGGRAAGVERVSVMREADRGRLAASLPLPLGFWLNGAAYIRRGDDGAPRISGRVGQVPVPAFLTHGLIGAARLLLRIRGADVPPLTSLVRRIEIGPAGMQAVVELPEQSRLFSALSGLRNGAIDSERVAAHYCRLRERDRDAPDPDFTAIVRHAFAGVDGSVDDNRALFVALSLLVAQIDAGAARDGKEAIFDRCGKSTTAFVLLGRDDLAKHWAVSAALTAAFGSEASISVGTWKEISDSGAGGSGFSLVDLAADRSGIFCAQRGLEAPTAQALARWLAAAQESDLLPVGALANAEGMTESEFRARFTDTDSSDFEAAVRRIDASLAVLMRF